jgi:hypothetical protein
MTTSTITAPSPEDAAVGVITAIARRFLDKLKSMPLKKAELHSSMLSAVLMAAQETSLKF